MILAKFVPGLVLQTIERPLSTWLVRASVTVYKTETWHFGSSALATSSFTTTTTTTITTTTTMTPFIQIPSVEEIRARRAAQEAERLRQRAEEDARLEKEYEEAVKKAEEEAKAKLERDRLEEIRQWKLAELEEEERRRAERRAEKRKRKDEEEEEEEEEEATEVEGQVSPSPIFALFYSDRFSISSG